MKPWYKSRKFWLAVVGAGVMVANEGLGLNLDGTTILAFAGIVISYILGEGVADAAGARRQ